MVKKIVLSAVFVLATWSVATASHAAFSIDLPGFSVQLPLPGAGVHIGLPVVATPPPPVYGEVEVYGPPVYVQPERHIRYYDYRPYRRHVPRDCDRGYGRYGGGWDRGYYRGR